MVNELRAVVRELGGRSVLGRNLASQRDLCEAIREGFPPAVVEELMRASGLTLKELADALDLSPRSLQRRRRSGRLARFESDRLYRMARIVALAQQSLGDRQSAARWLKRSNRALRKAFARAPFDGEGAYRYGGRWSSVGTRLGYTSEHQSLAMLEYFVHLDADDAPPDLVLAIAEIPDDLPRKFVKAEELPSDWRRSPAPSELAAFG